MLNLSNRETAVVAEQGGYSGPQLFERTLALVKAYRKALDDGMQRQPDPVSASTREPKSTDEGFSNQVADQIVATAQHDQRRLNDSTQEADNDSESQPLIQLPARNDPISKTSDPNTAALPAFTHSDPLPQTQSTPLSQPALFPSPSSATSSQISHAEAPKRKVIFASGGITNERQVQEILAAGSSIALLYTALVYGGVGTVSSIKSGLQEEMKRASEDGGVEGKN